MACRKVFVDPNSNLKGVCLNYPDTKEELRSFTDRFQDSLVEVLEMKFGDNWATEILRLRNKEVTN